MMVEPKIQMVSLGIFAFPFAGQFRDGTATVFTTTATTAFFSASATAGSFVGPTPRSTASFGSLHELTEFNAGIVLVRQLLREIRHFGRRVTEKMEYDVLSVE